MLILKLSDDNSMPKHDHSEHMRILLSIKKNINATYKVIYLTMS